MNPYDCIRFTPPAPVAHLTARNLHTRAAVADVPFLMDTGADLTAVPSAVIQFLGIDPLPGRRVEVCAFDDAASFLEIYRVGLLFCSCSFQVDVIVLDQAYGILGRNILNKVELVLNGPGLTWSEVQSPAPP